MKFSELNISKEVLRAISDMGFEEMTEIQEKTIPLLMAGNDVVGRSNTGTGKTACFGIPAVESITISDRRTVAVLILCPTRELAVQACGEIEKFSKYKRSVRACAVYGGASMERQIRELKNGANIVIGTPGRVLDHIRRGTLSLENLRTLVLDEADEMLRMGFREDIETVIKHVPTQRQTVLFSATMPSEILAITEKYQNNPVHIKIKSAQRTVSLVEQFYCEVPMGRKTDALKLLLSYLSPSSAMIFCNTKKMVDELTEELSRSGVVCAGLHGDMKQSQRTQVMNSFRSGGVSLLIATDVAARGIDVSGVDAVFNYDIPQDYEYYIHRTGRTGRAGHTGKAYTLVSGRRQLGELKNISEFVRAEIKKIPVPMAVDIAERRTDKIVDELLGTKVSDRDRTCEILEKLLSEGLDSREIALRLLSREIDTSLKNIPDCEITPPERHSIGRRTKIILDVNIGRDSHISPNFILGAFAEATGLSGRDFGKIDIYDRHTTIEVPADEYTNIISKTNPMKIKGQNVEVKLFSPVVYDRKSKHGNSRKRPDRKKWVREKYDNYVKHRKRDGRKGERRGRT